jgi:protein-L-isoaspartate O-methyltransferase
MNESTTSAEFFERKYRKNPDPWNFAGSEYERSRYDVIIAALGDQRFECAFEPGCSVGELTAMLATRCGHVVAIDTSATAIERAKRRCQHLANVELHVGALPDSIPNGKFDLVVFSEIGYYFDEGALPQIGNLLVDRLQIGGMFLAAHWLGTSGDHVISGDRVHEILRGIATLELQHAERHSGFRLDRWVRI